MSKELPSKPSSNEEVDLIVFFNLIGAAITKVLNFFYKIIKRFFSALMYALKALFKNWKIVLGIMFLAAIVGYGLEKIKPNTYSTSMLVEPYFNSKYQLVNNIDYFNALIKNEDKESLKSIFKVNDEILDKIIAFEIEPGPETENDRLLQYEDFISKLDSVRAQQYSYEDFIENRSVYSGRYFLIKAYASKPNIFKDLEEGILSSFVNNYSNKAMKRRDELLKVQKENLEEQLRQVKELQKVYIDVIEKESDNKQNSLKVGDISISGSDKQNTKEYELLREEQRIRNELKQLEEKKIEEDVIFEVISSFQEVGNVSRTWKDRYMIIFPLLSFVLLVLYFIAKKVITFTLNYED
ncbi:GumC domain-containing protein [Olleya aquimaris]|uniref:Uncharacterized protein n=1 Tax=Olleya aquimaris TaxID=639310 RepID=A0A327RN24_9FLAO|nr:hypothetical protein [Olleya aquimaris]RAJ17891.1 hypothetical protein LY08_00161 [Olleya aquimaris]